MNKRRQKRGIVCCLLLLLITGIPAASVRAASGGTDAEAVYGMAETDEMTEMSETSFRLELYQYNACASCHPEEELYQILGEELREFRESNPYEIFEYNPFRTADRERLQAVLKEHGLQEKGVSEPVLLVGNRCLIGLDEIREQVKEVYRQQVFGTAAEEQAGTEAENQAEDGGQESAQAPAESSPSETAAVWAERMRQAKEECGEQDSVLLYFSTISCDACSEAKTVLNSLPASAVLQDGSASAVRIYEFNIMEADYVELLQKLFAEYEVPSGQQQVPIIFYQDGFLSGEEQIKERLAEELSAGKMQGFQWSIPEQENGKAAFSPGTCLSLMLTGLVNGLNPCGASMLLMLLAAAAVAGRSVWKLGLSYLAGKFAAYFAMGLGLYHLFLSVNQEILLRVSRMITWIFAGCFFVLAVMYLLDFIHAKRQEFGKVRMQLPGALRKWNHRLIERVSGISGAWLLPSVGLLGVIISAGEFFCTGQVYLAAILYLLKLQENGGGATMAAFLLYVTAMCIPSLLLVLVIEKTRNVIRASNTALAWLPFIKLVTAAVFLAVAVFLLLY